MKKLKPDEQKARHSIRIRVKHSNPIKKQFGSIQKWIDYLISIQFPEKK